MKTNLLLLLLLTVARVANAMSWQELNTQISLAEAGKPADPAAIRRLVDIVDMLVIYTGEQAATDKSSLLFCAPENQTFNLNEVVSLVRARAKTTMAEDSVKVQHLLLDAFKQAYPCPTPS